MNFIVPLTGQLSADDLLIFAQVATNGSFTAAAEALNKPKSTISRRINALEEQLGERLFMRTTRHMRLTDFGHSLLAPALQVAEEVSAAWALSEERKQEPTGRLRVSIPSDFTNLFLSEMLAAFISLHPKVNLELDLSSRRVDLISEGFDLAVRIGQMPEDSLLVAKKLALMRSSLYASPTYLLNHGEPKHPDQLRDHQILLLQNSSAQKVTWRLTKEQTTWQEPLFSRIQANSPEALMHLACQHAGIVALPCQFAQPKMQLRQLTPVLADWQLPSEPVWAVFPGRRLLAAKTRAFLNLLVSSLDGF